MITAKEFIDCEEWWRVRQERDTLNAMIAFAKMHVESALKASSEKGEVDVEMCMGQRTGVVTIDENSIINAYPLTNII